MREIKFRAWDKLHKRMEEMSDMPVQRWVYDGCFDDLIDGIQDSHILMQYTGLKDCNGKEIYEGDIQKQTLGKHCWIYVVKSIGGQFGNQLFSMTIKHNLSTDENDEFYTFEEVFLKDSEVRNYVKSGNDVEIIGNIYENPELLKDN